MMSRSSNVNNPTKPANDTHIVTPMTVPMAPVKETAPAEKPTK